ncbi:hypothetical protein GCM10027161_01690 [Microbispora hainanensis]
MNAKLWGLVQVPADLLEEPDCPGLSPHLRTAVPEPEKLLWVSQPRGRYRVVDYTCDCEAVFYELISCGGSYQIHKVVQSEPPEHSYAGGWQSGEARLWWHLVLLGRVR